MPLFPGPVYELPRADIPIKGLTAFLSQGSGHQILFMEFAEDAELATHSHASQWGVVLEGKIELIIGGLKRTFVKGDRYFIPAGKSHSGKICAGYADITYFDQGDRYSVQSN